MPLCLIVCGCSARFYSGFSLLKRSYRHQTIIFICAVSEVITEIVKSGISVSSPLVWILREESANRDNIAILFYYKKMSAYQIYY